MLRVVSWTCDQVARASRIPESLGGALQLPDHVVLQRLRRAVQAFSVGAVLPLLHACGADDRAQSDAPMNEGRLDQPEAEPLASTQSLGDLLGRLRNIEGQFTISQTAMWSLEGHDDVFAAFYDHGDTAVRALVECLDDPSASRVTLLAAPVPFGVLCGLALQRTAYPTEHEDGDGSWDGAVHPSSTVEQLVRAKEAWLEVLRTGRYRIA